MKIKLINDEHDKRLCSVEAQKDDIAMARSLLENSLTYQFQKLALGLCSYEALQGKLISNYCLNPLKSYFSWENETFSIEAMRQRIALGTIRKEWEIISLAQLCDIEIRLFNKYVKLWNDIEINEQLALLGSSFRFYFAGSDHLSIIHIKSLVGYGNNSLSLDGRFIFGEIVCASATYFGPLFYFTKEVAISPYFNESEPGFTVDDTTVLRDVILKGGSKDHALIHELLHAFSYGYKDGLPFGVANWQRWIERDICRFLIDTHTFQELQEAVGVYQQATDGLVDHMLQYSKETRNKFNALGFLSFQDIFEDLIKKEKILIEEKDKYTKLGYILRY